MNTNIGKVKWPGDSRYGSEINKTSNGVDFIVTIGDSNVSIVYASKDGFYEYGYFPKGSNIDLGVQSSSGATKAGTFKVDLLVNDAVAKSTSLNVTAGQSFADQSILQYTKTNATSDIKLAIAVSFIGEGEGYLITFNSGGGSAAEPKSVTPGSAVGALTTPTRTGYKFLGWYTAASGGTKISSATVPTKNTTYYAQWTAAWKATWNVNGGTALSPNYTMVQKTKAVGTLPAPTRTGYTFAGWYTAASGGTKIATTTVPTKNTTYYAHWTVKTFTVTFNVNGGTALAAASKTKSVTYDAKYGTLPTTTQTGYKLAGWYTAKTGGTKVSSSAIVAITANRTLYAHWDEAWTVKWNANGGTAVSPASVLIVKGKTVAALPTAPTRTGYKLAGWYTAASGGTKITAETVPAKNVTYYAQWTAKTYTATFDVNGGTALASNTKSVTYAAKFGTLPAPTRSSYKFLGWYTAKTGGTKILSTATVAITKNTTYYAQWAAAYKATWNVNGGTALSTKYTMVQKTKAIGTLPTPTRDGYTFSGWYTAASGGSKIAATTVPAKSVTYYAHWKKA
jgi:uncharacterized repeat protein (TIGR02543 family)